MHYLTRVNLILTVNLLQFLIHTIYPTKNVDFLKRYHQKSHIQVSFYRKGYQDAVIVSCTATPPKITTSIYPV